MIVALQGGMQPHGKPPAGDIRVAVPAQRERAQVKPMARGITSDRGTKFLAKVNNGKYDREIITGLRKFYEGVVPQDMREFYSTAELEAIKELDGTSRDVQARMPVKITRHYFERAKTSKPVQTLVKASPKETYDLDGAEDPGKQMSYSPVEGLIHKYELGLIYVASTCSAHCRFCYREELIAKKMVTREDGTAAPKGLAQIPEIVEYIKEHNRRVDENGGRHPESDRERLREILMSGGDPMVLGNQNIAHWLGALAEAGIENIRIGTKEMAFYPMRFDEKFFAMLDAFHDAYPRTNLRMMVHFNHPDEFLLKDPDGGYIAHPQGGLTWVPEALAAAQEFKKRPWINIDNQSPIIKDINDDPNALRIMQRELKRNGIENHYFFCGRDIIGHKAFNVPIERAWQIVNESQKGLSGVETHARLSITHFKGKTEVAAVTDKPFPGVKGGERGVVIFKLLRSVADASDRCKITIVGRNPKAIWFSGYDDRVIMDEAELYAMYGIPTISQIPAE
jgi:L-lysine 2,3-aminomutase